MRNFFHDLVSWLNGVCVHGGGIIGTRLQINICIKSVRLEGRGEGIFICKLV